MTNCRFSRGEILAGAGAVTIAGLTACDHSASSLLPGSGNSQAFGSQYHVKTPDVEVKKPTGAAIQKAIDGLPSSGGTVQLTADVPYVIDKALVINKRQNITLIGRGPIVTRLQAKSGAQLKAPGQNAECILAIDSSTGITIQALECDTNNENNSSGLPRYGIGAWSAKSLTISAVTFINGQGSDASNEGLSVNDSSKVQIENCKVLDSRTGFALTNVTNFTVTSCLVQDCQGVDASTTSAGIAIVSSTSGRVSGCYLTQNQLSASIYLQRTSSVLVGSSRVSYTQPFGSTGNPGILIDGGNDRINVRRTLLAHNSGSGVVLTNSTIVTVKACTIFENGKFATGGNGINLAGGNSKVELYGNRVLNSHRPAPDGSSGIAAGFGDSMDSDTRVHDVTVHGWDAGVSLGQNSKSIDVSYNDLRFNKKCVNNGGSGNQVGDNRC